MKLILKFGVAALLFAFLAIPSLAEKHQGYIGETEKNLRRYAPSPTPEVKATKTPTGSRIGDIEGESSNDKHRNETTRTNVKDISIPKTIDKSTPSLK
jgi:hypothetical protein